MEDLKKLDFMKHWNLEEQLLAWKDVDKGGEKHKGKFRFGSIISVLIAIALIVVGSLKLNDCTIEPMIPIYLIVTGCLNILTAFVTLSETAVKGDEALQGCKCINFILGVTSCGWFIAGNVWLFNSLYPDYVETESSSYCDQTAFTFAMVYIIGVYVLMGVALVLACCCGCVGLCCGVCFVCARIAAKIEATNTTRVDDVHSKEDTITEA